MEKWSLPRAGTETDVSGRVSSAVDDPATRLFNKNLLFFVFSLVHSAASQTTLIVSQTNLTVATEFTQNYKSTKPLNVVASFSFLKLITQCISCWSRLP